MRWGIRQLGFGRRDFVEIDAEEFREIQKARQVLVLALFIEQKFRLLLKNHIELEQSVLTIANEYMLLPEKTLHARRSEPLFELSRRLVNVLTTGRLYIDQVKGDVQRSFGSDSEEAAQIKATFSEQYDGLFGYRVMEAMRNHTQHRGLPVHTFHQRALPHKSDENQPRLVEHSCHISTSVEKLKIEGGFKASILEEMQGKMDSKGNVSLIPLVREYVLGIERAHRRVRSVMEAKVKTAKAVISVFVDRYAEVAGDRGRSEDGRYLGLTAVAEDPDGFVEEDHQLPQTIIQDLEFFHGELPDLTTHFVSSRAAL